MFDYGQWYCVEIDVVCELVLKLGVCVYKVLDVILFNELVVSSLMCDSILVFDYEFEVDGILNTFVLGCNILFLMLVVIYVYQVKVEVVIIGVCEMDFFGYLDCCDEFVKVLNYVVSLGMVKDICFEMLLMWIDKVEIWVLVDYYGKLDLVCNEMLICYNGFKGDGCGYCVVCNLCVNGLNYYLVDKLMVMVVMKQKIGLR